MEPSTLVLAILRGINEAQASIHMLSLIYHELPDGTSGEIAATHDKSQICPLENSRRAAARVPCLFLQLEAEQTAATNSHSLLQTISVRRATSGPGEARTRATARSHPKSAGTRSCLGGCKHLTCVRPRRACRQLFLRSTAVDRDVPGIPSLPPFFLRDSL